MKTVPRRLSIFSALLLVLGASHALADTTITTLPYTVTTSGVYRLADDLTVSSANGITIQADDVLIDLGGHTITSTSGNTNYTGIFVNSSVSTTVPRRNVAVQNGTIRGFRRGVYFNGPASSGGNNVPAIGFRASDVKVIGSGDRGIEFGLCQGSVIERCSLLELGGVASGISTPYGVFTQGGVVVRDCYVSKISGNNGGNTTYAFAVFSGFPAASSLAVGNFAESTQVGLLLELGVYRNNAMRTLTTQAYQAYAPDAVDGGGNN